MVFTPPTADKRIKAIRSVNELPETLRAAFDPSADFEPISAPKLGDCLAVHSERGQTFNNFVKSKPNRPEKLRRKIYLFSGKQPLKDVRAAFAGACKRGKIEKLRFHDQRHTFASNLVSHGNDIITVKDSLGHSCISTTMCYAHTQLNAKRQAVQSPIGRKVLQFYDNQKSEGIGEAVSKPGR